MRHSNRLPLHNATMHSHTRTHNHTRRHAPPRTSRSRLTSVLHSPHRTHALLHAGSLQRDSHHRAISPSGLTCNDSLSAAPSQLPPSKHHQQQSNIPSPSSAHRSAAGKGSNWPNAKQQEEGGRSARARRAARRQRPSIANTFGVDGSEEADRGHTPGFSRRASSSSLMMRLWGFLWGR